MQMHGYVVLLTTTEQQHVHAACTHLCARVCGGKGLPSPVSFTGPSQKKDEKDENFYGVGSMLSVELIATYKYVHNPPNPPALIPNSMHAVPVPVSDDPSAGIAMDSIRPCPWCASKVSSTAHLGFVGRSSHLTERVGAGMGTGRGTQAPLRRKKAHLKSSCA